MSSRGGLTGISGPAGAERAESRGWGERLTAAARSLEVLRLTLRGGQRPVKSGIPDQWSRNNCIVRRKRAASTAGHPSLVPFPPECGALGPKALELLRSA